MEVLTKIPFELDADAVLRKLRVDPDSDDARPLLEALDAARPHFHPKALHDVRYIEAREGDSIDLGGVRLKSHVLSVNVKDAERVFPVIATCGTEIADHAAGATDIMVKYALDVAMEQALHAALSHVRATLDEWFALGQTSMMNPGSLDDWPMSQQAQLFALFGDVKDMIGVELTSSYLMIPLKSLSGIVFPTEIRFETCQLCPRENCPSRRAPYDASIWEERYRNARRAH
jgi:hypothetical protein